MLGEGAREARQLRRQVGSVSVDEVAVTVLVAGLAILGLRLIRRPVGGMGVVVPGISGSHGVPVRLAGRVHPQVVVVETRRLGVVCLVNGTHRVPDTCGEPLVERRKRGVIGGDVDGEKDRVTERRTDEQDRVENYEERSPRS